MKFVLHSHAKINRRHSRTRGFCTRSKTNMAQVRGGSRVVQVISRNHSNVSKPAFISQVLYCSSRNQLSFLFYCLLSSKTKKKASYLVIPYHALPERIRRVSVRTLSSFVDTSENNAKKFVGTTGENLYAVGDWMVYASFSQITQNPLRLARNTHIVLRTTQTRL